MLQVERFSWEIPATQILIKDYIFSLRENACLLVILNDLQRYFSNGAQGMNVIQCLIFYVQ